MLLIRCFFTFEYDMQYLSQLAEFGFLFGGITGSYVLGVKSCFTKTKYGSAELDHEWQAIHCFS